MIDYKKEYIEYSNKSEEEVLAYLIDVLLRLGFTPKESLSSFKKWFEKRINKYDITGDQLEVCIDSYYDYWSEVDKQIKNFKVSFFNNPILRRHLLPQYKTKVYNINDI